MGPKSYPGAVFWAKENIEIQRAERYYFLMMRTLALLFILSAPALAGEKIFKCSVAALRPTQLAVGMAEVGEKEKKLRGLSPQKLAAYQRKNPEPVVRGPGGALYIIDHHHLARALANLKIDGTYCTQAADLSKLSSGAFWAEMAARKWVYSKDETGAPRPYSALPASVAGLKDDPYRSLAGAVRKAGGYDKSPRPFAEFLWADFFRPRIARADIEADFDKCLQIALLLARSEEAAGLPGYKGR
jgi:hypothetical protein